MISLGRHHYSLAKLLLGLLTIAAGILALIIYLTAWRPAQPALSCSGQPCNVILIAVDTLGAKHLSLYGYERETSPFIDRFFGTEGIVFKNAWTAAPWTLPAFSSLLTSQYPSDHKAERFEDKLSPDIPSLEEVLRDNGVQLMAVQSDHLLRYRHGVFERFKGRETRKAGDALQFHVAFDWVKGWQESWWTRRRPFFLFIHNWTVHDPYNPPPGYRDLFPLSNEKEGAELIADSASRRQRAYDQEVRYLDDLLKKFVEDLPENVRDHTIIILTGDHGEGFGEHEKSNHANSLYEELLHVPLLVRIPNFKPLVIDELVSWIDLAPTIAGVFGAEMPSSFKGSNLGSSLNGGTLSEKVIKSELVNFSWPKDQAAVEALTPTVRTSPLPQPGSIAVRLSTWKLIKNSGGRLELYNLDCDPGEQHDLFPVWRDLSSGDQELVQKLFATVGVAPQGGGRKPEPQNICRELFPL